MIHPHTELRSAREGVGHGVFATRTIPRGTLTWVRDRLDRSLEPEVLATFPPPHRSVLEKYSYRDESGRFVLPWDATRFMNHSCEPSAAGTDFGLEIAVRDLRPGDELTVDYALLRLQPHEAFSCLCGAPSCRGRVDSEEPEALRARDRRLLRETLLVLSRVPQPLLPFLDEDRLGTTWRELGLSGRPPRLEELSAGGTSAPSESSA